MPGHERSWAPPPLRPYRSMVISVALTGAIPTKAVNRRVPITPEEIATDAADCVSAGAAAVHLHVRDEREHPVHRRDLYERTIGLIRERVPDVIVCVTTSSRVGTDPELRMTGLDLASDLRPDMASLTLGSFNFPRSVNANPPDVIERLLGAMAERDIRPELEVFELGMINTLHVLRDRGLIPDPAVVNILLGSFGAAPAFVGDLALMVQRLPAQAEWAAAGIGQFQRPMTIAAAVMGGNVRTGLEDAPTDDEPDWSNVRAVARAVAAAELVGREVASVGEARRRFGLRDP